MLKMKSFSKRLLENNKGQGMVEYILILVVVVAIVSALKGKLTQYVGTDMFDNLKGQISGVLSPSN